MEKAFTHRIRYKSIILGTLILLGLYFTSLYSYLLFHSLSEIFSIMVACGIFMVAWNSQKFLDNNYLLFIGVAYLFIGGLDLFHTLAYKGMGVFHGYNADLPTQLWIAARYLESLSLFIAPLFLNRRIIISFAFWSYSVVTALLLISIFGDSFPNCFVEGVGLTTFKKGSEYVISLILMSSIIALFHKRNEFDESVFRLLVASIILTIGAEFAFTFYISVYGFSNLVGHYFKLISFYLIYKAIIETGLVKPYDLLFRKIKKSEEIYRSIISESPVGISIYDESGQCVDANDSTIRIVGATKEQVLQQNYNNLESWKKSGMLYKAKIAVKEQTTQRHELIVETTFGKVVKLDCYLVPFFSGGLLLMVTDITERKQAEEEREKLINELQEALKEIKTLRGILPLCSFCKKIRDDEGFWEQVDVYIHKHLQADISHSICPDCAKEHYPDLEQFDD